MKEPPKKHYRGFDTFKGRDKGILATSETDAQHLGTLLGHDKSGVKRMVFFFNYDRKEWTVGPLEKPEEWESIPATMKGLLLLHAMLVPDAEGPGSRTTYFPFRGDGLRTIAEDWTQPPPDLDRDEVLSYTVDGELGSVVDAAVQLERQDASETQSKTDLAFQKVDRKIPPIDREVPAIEQDCRSVKELLAYTFEQLEKHHPAAHAFLNKDRFRYNPHSRIPDRDHPAYTFEYRPGPVDNIHWRLSIPQGYYLPEGQASWMKS